MPEITIAAGSVSIQTSAILRTVESCNPEPLAAMVAAMPEDNTWVVETGNPYPADPRYPAQDQSAYATVSAARGKVLSSVQRIHHEVAAAATTMSTAAKGGGRGDCEPAKHVPGAGPGKRVTGAGTHTTSRKAKEEGEVHCGLPPSDHRIAPLCSSTSQLLRWSSDFSRPCVIGYGSSPSRCRPKRHSRRPDARSPGSRARSVGTCQVL